MTPDMAVAMDPLAILRDLGHARPVTVTALTANRDKGVWRVDSDEGTHALRVLRPDEHATARHEELAMGAARGVGIPVPGVTVTGSWQRRPAMLLSWCSGRTVQDEARARPWAVHHLGVICGRLQAELNRITPPPALASVDWKTRLGGLDDALRSRLETVETAVPRLLHLDFHPQNVVIQGDTVTGILDWTNACAGDPRADLARSWSLLVAYPRAGGVRASVAGIVNRLLAAGWLGGYESASGAQSDMLLFRIWAVQGLLRTLTREVARYGARLDLAPLHARLASMRARVGLPALPATG